MLKLILIVIVAAIALLLIVAATRPDTFRVQRSARIKAPKEKIFALINDFHRWATWSPYEKLDPAMNRSFSGSEAGAGAVYAWNGNDKAGAGRMEITDTSPSKITIDLDFERPFKNHCVAEFTLDDNGGDTNVTWALQGRDPFIGKLFSLFFNRDKMVGKDFEAGLATLKTATES